MTEHRPMLDIITAMDCYYGECEHVGECPERVERICDTCVVPADDDLGVPEGVVPWPCQYAHESTDQEPR